MDIYSHLEKPTMLLNPDKVRRNIERMAFKAREQRIRFRPHFKTHQSIGIGDWFRPVGVRMITVSSVDMALYFVNAGWEDITIAFPVNWHQMRSINDLAHRSKLGLLIESLETVETLAQNLTAPVDIWVKLDTGNHRTGLAWDCPGDIASVVKAVLDRPQMSLRGLLTHSGNTYGAKVICQKYSEGVDRMDAARADLEKLGIRGLDLSVGDTPGCTVCPDLGWVDEIRPGNFVFYDAEQVAFGTCKPDDVAVTVACPVVAKHPERSEVVIYGGAIHLSKDFFMDGEQRVYGTVALPEGNGWGDPLPGSYVRSLSQEHGVVHLGSSMMSQVKVGDWLCIFPAHVCLTVTLMRDYLTLDGQVIHTMNSA